MGWSVPGKRSQLSATHAPGEFADCWAPALFQMLLELRREKMKKAQVKKKEKDRVECCLENSRKQLFENELERCWKDGTVVGDEACGFIFLYKDGFVFTLHHTSKTFMYSNCNLCCIKFIYVFIRAQNMMCKYLFLPWLVLITDNELRALYG